MSLDHFHPIVRTWFEKRFAEPTEPQKLGWPANRTGENTLIAAPTGSGKTLTGFLAAIDDLLRQALDGRLEDKVQAVYVSPLKALSNDIHRNLQNPLSEIQTDAMTAGYLLPPLRAFVRTGDTPASDREAMRKNPPHILVTTPESLFLILTSPKSREMLRTVKTVIVDEIHAIARDKRGSHLSLSLARLEHLCQKPLQRIGLSATQKPLDEIANFLSGVDDKGEGRPCHIIDAGHLREMDLNLELPSAELSAVCSHETWEEIYDRLVRLIQVHHSTLLFVNTRRLAERLTRRLTERLGPDSVASHHGSLSRELRLSAEERLKAGELKALVATASLELGIDVGFIDLVCQIGSPRSVATLLQRVGRAGHALHAIPKGRLFPLTRDDLMEALALIRAVREGRLDRVEIPESPLDILAQQIIAACSTEEWNEDILFKSIKRTWPYRNLSRSDFNIIVDMLVRGADPKSKRGSYLHHDKIHRKLRAKRGARLASITSGGAIPDTADYRVVTEDRTFIGTVNEDFAIESQRGDIFLLGNTSWRIQHVRGGEVLVQDAHGAPASVPFWLGEAPGRTVELSSEISRLREELEAKLLRQDDKTITEWLSTECRVEHEAARQAVHYIHAQLEALNLIPTQKKVVFERFFDETGGMQLVIHAPFGTRINRAWGLALRKNFCRTFDFELQAAADDNAVILSLGPQHSFQIESLFKMIRPDNALQVLTQALLAAPFFQIRWRWNVTRALAVLRFKGGTKVPPPLQRFHADDLLTAIFPMQTACLENRPPDVTIPDHPLVRQTVHDCLHEAMDVNRWIKILEDVQSGTIELVARDTREPSPFCYEILNANPYAFLDDAPLEERRARAVATRRTLPLEDMKNLGQLDAAAIAQVKKEAWPLVRDKEELHDTLIQLGLLLEKEGEPWKIYFEELIKEGRATSITRNNLPAAWISAENWPQIKVIYPEAKMNPSFELPESLQQPVEKIQAMQDLLRDRMAVTGPITSKALAEMLGLDEKMIEATLESLEAEGTILRGRFNPSLSKSDQEKKFEHDISEWCARAGIPAEGGSATKYPKRESAEWCDRRLLSRIHRLTLEGLRRQVKPVSREIFWQFLFDFQHVNLPRQKEGRQGFLDVLWQLQGLEIPAGIWEPDILANRLKDYVPVWLDELTYSGEIAWGRLSPPDPRSIWKGTITRVVPIALVFREDLVWLLPERGYPQTGPRPNTRSAEARRGIDYQSDINSILRENAKTVLETLKKEGALFLSDIQKRTGLLLSHVEEALGELASLGQVSADGFAAIRVLVTPGMKQRLESNHRRHGSDVPRPSIQGGRWALFPSPHRIETGNDQAGAPAFGGSARKYPERTNAERYGERLSSWAWQLLQRYGIVFRDLLAHETAAPSWHELVPIYRRLELRGEIRGGRFVDNAAGEQYALPEAIDWLRRVRNEGPRNLWSVISAADPLNLTGVLNYGPRISATSGNRIILRDAKPVAALLGDETEFYEELSQELQDLTQRALKLSQAPQLRAEILQELNGLTPPKSTLNASGI
jgi:ATP-dependent Lhr-like helicase